MVCTVLYLLDELLGMGHVEFELGIDLTGAARRLPGGHHGLAAGAGVGSSVAQGDCRGSEGYRWCHSMIQPDFRLRCAGVGASTRLHNLALDV